MTREYNSKKQPYDGLPRGSFLQRELGEVRATLAQYKKFTTSAKDIAPRLLERIDPCNRPALQDEVSRIWGEKVELQRREFSLSRRLDEFPTMTVVPERAKRLQEILSVVRNRLSPLRSAWYMYGLTSIPSVRAHKRKLEGIIALARRKRKRILEGQQTQLFAARELNDGELRLLRAASIYREQERALRDQIKSDEEALLEEKSATHALKHISMHGRQKTPHSSGVARLRMLEKQLAQKISDANLLKAKRESLIHDALRMRVARQQPLTALKPEPAAAFKVAAE